MNKTVVIGGGAAGLFAAYSSALKGNKVILIEKNEKLGKKIYITGKGRCNLSNFVDINEFLNNVVSNSKFLYSALNRLSPSDTYSFFENLGLKLKIERGNRVFPLSDKASDVTKTLERGIKSLGAEVRLNEKVKDILTKDGKVTGIISDSGTEACDSVIVCTGGLSYPSTGSDGDGYVFAKNLGHTVTKLSPSLVGLELYGNEFLDMQGLSLKNVAIKVLSKDKVIYEDFGEMLFTHYGVSGPIILSASCILSKTDINGIKLHIDLKPALDSKKLDEKLQREFKERNISDVFNAMRSTLPKSLIQTVLNRASVKTKLRCCDLKRQDRENLVNTIKDLEFSIKGLRGYNEAIVTSGGINVKEINSKTMESKIIKGLFFAGEVLDVDCFTGGFNLQSAFSTGYTAGENS